METVSFVEGPVGLRAEGRCDQSPDGTCCKRGWYDANIVKVATREGTVDARRRAVALHELLHIEVSAGGIPIVAIVRRAGVFEHTVDVNRAAARLTAMHIGNVVPLAIIDS